MASVSKHLPNRLILHPAGIKTNRINHPSDLIVVYHNIQSLPFFCDKKPPALSHAGGLLKPHQNFFICKKVSSLYLSSFPLLALTPGPLPLCCRYGPRCKRCRHICPRINPTCRIGKSIRYAYPKDRRHAPECRPHLFRLHAHAHICRYALPVSRYHCLGRVVCCHQLCVRFCLRCYHRCTASRTGAG